MELEAQVSTAYVRARMHVIRGMRVNTPLGETGMLVNTPLGETASPRVVLQVAHVTTANERALQVTTANKMASMRVIVTHDMHVATTLGETADHVLVVQEALEGKCAELEVVAAKWVQLQVASVKQEEAQCTTAQCTAQCTTADVHVTAALGETANHVVVLQRALEAKCAEVEAVSAKCMELEVASIELEAQCTSAHVHVTAALGETASQIVVLQGALEAKCAEVEAGSVKCVQLEATAMKLEAQYTSAKAHVTATLGETANQIVVLQAALEAKCTEVEAALAKCAEAEAASVKLEAQCTSASAQVATALGESGRETALVEATLSALEGACVQLEGRVTIGMREQGGFNLYGYRLGESMTASRESAEEKVLTL